MKFVALILIALVGIGLVAPFLDTVPVAPRQDVFWSYSEIGELHIWPYK